VKKTFEEKFGKSAGEMDDGEWRMAVVDLFAGVCDRLDITNGSINLMWVIGGIYGSIIGGGLIWIVISYLNHCGVP
jgi:hypothetical protein